AVDFTRADVLVRLAVRALVGGRYRNDQVVQILVEAFDRELERMADFLLETEAGVHRAWAADPRRAERRDALVRLRRLMIEADSAFERRARIPGVHVETRANSRINGPTLRVRVVVRAHAGKELEVLDRRELEHGVRGRTKHIAFALQFDRRSSEEWPGVLRGVEVVGRRLPGHVIAQVLHVDARDGRDRR